MSRSEPETMLGQTTEVVAGTTGVYEVTWQVSQIEIDCGSTSGSKDGKSTDNFVLYRWSISRPRHGAGRVFGFLDQRVQRRVCRHVRLSMSGWRESSRRRPYNVEISSRVSIVDVTTNGVHRQAFPRNEFDHLESLVGRHVLIFQTEARTQKLDEPKLLSTESFLIKPQIACRQPAVFCCDG